MSKKIDLEEPLSGFDAEYVRARPWLLEDAKLKGIEVTFVEDGEEQDGAAETYTGEGWTKKTLLAEVERRNAELDEDDQIAPASDKNADLITALLEDDAAIAAAAEEE